MPIIDAWRGDSGHERRLPFRQSSRLVEGNCADPVRRLERLGVLDENARPGGNAGARHDSRGGGKEIGRAHARTPVTNAHLVCRLLLDKKKKTNNKNKCKKQTN